MTTNIECRSGHSNPGKFKFLIVSSDMPEISHVVEADAFSSRRIYLKGTLETLPEDYILGYGQTESEAWESFSSDT